MESPDDTMRARLRILWWVLTPIILFLALILAIVAATPLGHSGGGAPASFYFQLAAAVAVVTLIPLSLFSKRKSLTIRALQALGTFFLLLVLLLVLAYVYFFHLQPSLMDWRFQFETRAIKIVSVVETPYLDPATGSIPLGRRLVMTVRVPDAMPLDRHGIAILNALQGNMSVHWANPPEKSPEQGLYMQGGIETRYQGQKLADLPALRAILSNMVRPTPGDMIPAGDYQLSGIALPYDLRFEGKAAVLCKADPVSGSTARLRFPASSGVPLVVQFSATMDLEKRRGRSQIARKAALAYRYDDAAWEKTLATLALPFCGDEYRRQQAAKAIDDAEQERVAAQLGYATGNIDAERTALYAEACAGDVAALRSRIAAEKPADGPWLPALPLHAVLNDCALKDWQPEVFSLIAPAFVLQAEGKGGASAQAMCTMLERMHRKRNMVQLRAFAKAGATLDCPGQQLWRKGLIPEMEGDVDYKERLAAAIARDDNAPWIALLAASKVDLCAYDKAPVTDGSRRPPYLPLLTVITPRYRPDMMAAVIAAGCDPRARPLAPRYERFDPSEQPLEYYSAGVAWAMRRNRPADDKLTDPLPPANAALLARLDQLMRPGMEEMREPSPGRGRRTVLTVLNRRIIASQPGLLRTLVQAGAELSGGQSSGISWFPPFYVDDLPAKRVIALLDVLNDQQLKAVVNSPGMTLAGARMPAVAPGSVLGAYICRRGALDCT